MAKQIYYKKYNRGTRLQTIDTVYSGGMSYTNTPLVENYSKALVNYDITKDNTLRSRPGLARIKQYQHEAPAPMQLLDVQTITTYDTNDTYQHIVLGATVGEDVESDLTTLKSGALAFCKCDEDALVVDKNNIANNALACSYISPEIHGLNVTKPMLRYVGTRAFNNDYYWFAPDGTLNHAGYLLTAYDKDTNNATYDFTSEAISPKECKVSEATSRGYNMLSEEPYAFPNTFSSAATSLATFTGIMPYKDAACTQIELTPQLGQTVYLKIVGEFKTTTVNGVEYVQVGYENAGLQSMLEASINNGAEFYQVALEDINKASTTVANIEQKSVIPFTVSKDSTVILRASLKYRKTDGTLVPLSTIIVAFDFGQKKDTEAINYDLQTYTLKYAEGMTYWKERLILWGVPEDKSMLFVSETRDPSYFPYPNNVSLFDEPIVNVIPLLDNLVVFTTSKIYIMGLDTDYVHLTQKCIQNNLRINPYDVHLMQVVKNMIFFKSGNYYYMIVPKAQSLTGELTIAPVSKNIEYFLDNFKEELYILLETVYNYSKADCDDLEFVHYYNYLDYEDVTNVYVFKTPEGRYLNFCLLYNTVQRHWRIYTYETSSIMQPVTHDATDKSVYGVLTNNVYETYKFDYNTAVDTMGTIFKNYQLYDSGYRDQEYNLKKRYRELQFIIYNRSLKNLKFGTGFFIDGGTRRALYKMEPIIKTLSEMEYNTSYTGTEQHVELVINHTFDNIAEIPGATVLGSWIIDQSVFPEQTVYKVRFPVAGKGYAPRVLLVNKDGLQHDILNTSYVYRSLYSR